MAQKEAITADEDFERLDLYLHQKFPDFSRSMIQRLIQQNHIRLDGKLCLSKSQGRAGSLIEIEIPDATPTTLEAQESPMEILFEDKHLLVLNKSQGMVVHPGAGHADHTLVNALLHHCKGQLSGIGGVERPGIVHRLDKDTSGCLVVAKNDSTHRALVEIFQSRSIEKIYLALVWGTPRTLSGKINKAIDRNRVHRKKMMISDEGREALTEWKVREKFKTTTLLECRLHTGRTHQIRVHLASEGLPLLGDSLYGRAKDPNLKQLAKRQMLHSWRLSFIHPITHSPISCEAKLPSDMSALIELLRENTITLPKIQGTRTSNHKSYQRSDLK
jgi:23S rRNA pseudouridine1911/1915/1917 synthase